ncbi:MAG: DUF4010 domain-containing protein [Caldisphaera sp.]|jgi:uncharacterized membrane protein (DUF4010 family)|nr:MAG: hypothetical protein C0201_01115 [Caldisphaera sp.]
MEEIPLQNLLMAIAAGGIVGFVNEYRKITGSKIFLGLRTAIFISLLGYMFSIFSKIFSMDMALLASIITIVTISTAIYLEKVRVTGSPGGTTYVSIFLVFFSGMLEGLGYFELGIIISVLVASLGIYKTQLLDAISKIRKEDLLGILNLMIFSLVILPFLPNKYIGPYSLFNPFQFWFIVVIIATIFVAQYIVLKIYRKGLMIFSIIGGIVSSTTVTISLIELSNKNEKAGKAIAFNILFSNLPLVLVQILAFSYFTTGSFSIVRHIGLTVLLLIISMLIIFVIGKKYWESEYIETPEAPLPVLRVLEFAIIFFIIMILAKIVVIVASYLLPLTIFASSFANAAGSIFSIGLLYLHNQINAEYAAFLIQLTLLAAIMEKAFLVFLSKNKYVKLYTIVGTIALSLIVVLTMII